MKLILHKSSLVLPVADCFSITKEIHSSLLHSDSVMCIDELLWLRLKSVHILLYNFFFFQFNIHATVIKVGR